MKKEYKKPLIETYSVEAQQPIAASDPEFGNVTGTINGGNGRDYDSETDDLEW